uniref:hypothetical protein n=1 Tax=Promicromonospora sp. CA-289581 TaxID=3240013 RepID=UPI003F492D7A
MERPHWAERIRRERQAHGWSQPAAVANLRAIYARETGKEAVGPESLLRQWKAWEAGDNKPTHWAPYVAQVFGTVEAEMFPPDRAVDALLISEAGMDTAELVARLQRSSITDDTVYAVRVKVEQLCTAYRLTSPAALRAEGQAWLRRIDAMLHEPVTYAQHGELLSLGGRLALLVGCVENDAGDQVAAETTRAYALKLGSDVDDRDVMGWAYEMTAWFALTSGDLHRAVAASRAGMEVAGPRGVSVQLAAQAAKAWSRLGNRHEVEVSLERGREVLDKLPAPVNPDDHFAIDPSKWVFYEMDAQRNVGNNDRARLYAEEVLRAGVTPWGEERSPMRNAEARLTLAVVAARDGAIDDAVELGTAALTGPRVSVPSLTMVGRELTRELAAAGLAEDPRTREYDQTLTALATA